MLKSKYEIMILLDAKASQANLEKFLESVFKQKVAEFEKFEKLERTELAYEINKTKYGQYFVVVLETQRDNIAEFTRLSNINKEILRQLVVNLDTEKGLNKPFKRNGKIVKGDKEKSFHRDFDKTRDDANRRPRKPYVRRTQNGEAKGSEDKKPYRPRVAKKVVENKKTEE